MPVNIPSVTYGSQFGNINKCVWFETVNNYNYFAIDISVEKSQIKDTNLALIDSTSRLQKWTQIFPKSTGSDPYEIRVKILQVPNLNSINYVFQNKAN